MLIFYCLVYCFVYNYLFGYFVFYKITFSVSVVVYFTQSVVLLLCMDNRLIISKFVAIRSFRNYQALLSVYNGALGYKALN